MKRSKPHPYRVVLFVAVALVMLYALSQFGTLPVAEPRVPAGFRISLLAKGLNPVGVNIPGPMQGPRMMAYNNGIVYVSVPGSSAIIGIPGPAGGNSSPFSAIAGLTRPHGIAVHEGWLYIAQESRVVKARIKPDGTLDSQSISTIIPNLPSDGGHWTRTITIHKDKLYVSIGSSCNVCVEQNPWRASIIRCDLDGSGCGVFASGIRNAVGMTWIGDDLFATDNGRDWAGEDLPPDELNKIIEGKDYGWPYCYENNVPDPEMNRTDSCAKTQSPVYGIQAHSAPLGLLSYDGTMFPPEFKGNLFVAYHGSWNRKEKTGYKVVRLIMDGSGVVKEEDFITNWVTSSGTVTGRPVDLLQLPDGSLLVSDDFSGRVWRVEYTG